MKRPRLKSPREVIKELRYGDFLNADLARTLLYSMDAGDAMNMTLAWASTDLGPLLQRIMRTEEIWYFWFKRDFPWIMTRLKLTSIETLPHWLSNNVEEIEVPKWKVVYLWYRLVIGGYQWTMIITLASETFRYVGFNLIAMKAKLNENEPTEKLVTFDEFIDIWTQGRPQDLVNVKEPWKDLKLMNQGRYISFIQNRYPEFPILFTSKYGKFAYSGLTIYGQILEDLVNDLHSFRRLEPYDSLLSKVPRVYDTGRIMLGCAYCGNSLANLACEDCDLVTRYCDSKCQKNHWEIHSVECAEIGRRARQRRRKGRKGRKGLSSKKAREILRHKSVRGHKLTPKQRRYFGWVAGGRK